MGSEAYGLHVFFLPFMAHSHIIPLIDVARLFAARGTKSTIVTTALNALHFSESIDRDREAGLDIAVQIIPFNPVDAGLPQGCEEFHSLTSPQMIATFFMAHRLLQQPFDKLVGELRPHCIVADLFLSWPSDVAHKYGIPRVVFHGTSNFSMCVMENIERYSPQEKVASDSETFLVPGLPDKIEMMVSQLPHHDNSAAKKMHSEWSVITRETELKSFGVIVNSFYELEPSYADYYTKDLGRRAWNIGPVSLYNKRTADKSWRGKKASIDEHQCVSWLDSKEDNSILYVSFGSISRFGTAQLHEIALGLEASGVSFIWVIRMDKNKEKEQFLPEGFQERMEGKGLIVNGWAPQVLILDHPAVGGFMTHCGWNSTLEGISAGVPFITWPLFAEQFNNEKFITEVLKIGVRSGNEVWSSWIEPENVSVKRDRIEVVVKQLMGSGEEAEDRRRCARELGDMAKRAVQEGGSSYTNMTALINEIRGAITLTLPPLIPSGIQT